jgi:tetratricopeptide (TPR) repeat protein
MPLLLLSLFIGFVGQTTTTSDLEQADAMRKAGLEAQAIPLYEKLLERQPNLAAGHLGLAWSLVWRADAPASRKADDYSRAETHFRRAIDLASDSEFRREALFDFASSFRLSKPPRIQEGLNVLGQVVAARADDVLAHLARASLYFDPKTLDRYVQELKGVRDRFPKSVDARYTLGEALRDAITASNPSSKAVRVRLLRESVGELDEALRLEPDHVLALMRKGLVLRDLAELETDRRAAAALEAEAKRLFDRAEALNRGRGGR